MLVWLLLLAGQGHLGGPQVSMAGAASPPPLEEGGV